jgi:hypothetical protein
MEETDNSQPQRRRRRRRRRRRNTAEGTPQGGGRQEARGGGRGWKKHEIIGPSVTLPPTGRIPNRRMAVHPESGRPANGPSRRRRLNRAEVEELSAYIGELPEQYIANIYDGMGGQPDRLPSRDRMIQLTVKAIAQGNRLSSLVRSIHQRDRQALAILVQCGGLAQHKEFHQELIVSLGGSEREWIKVMTNLGTKGLIAATEEREGTFFYLIPQPMMGFLIEPLRDDMVLPSFEHDDVRVVEDKPFAPPVDFSITTLATYIDQHPPRLTQRQEIFKTHKEEMDEFFSQLWDPDSELFSFHIEFLMMHGLVELRGDRLTVNRSVVEEWLQLDPADQRDLVFAALDKRLGSAEWILWTVGDVGGGWVADRPLQALYRRWMRGEDWRDRHHKGQWATPRSSQREGYSFSPLVEAGMLELGQWGQEKFYRLSSRAKRLLDPPEDEGFTQFYLTPSFEIMAPAGMAPILFFRIGELGELTACDRANTYRITEVTIERALEKGWRREEILEFLRDNSQIGLPENVEQTLRGWMGQHGDVEFHDLTILTVHRSQIRRLESARALKPYLLHRFVPGMYAVDKTRMAELNQVLVDNGFAVSPQTRTYPDDPQVVESRTRLLHSVAEARDQRNDPLSRAHAADTEPALVRIVPGAGASAKKGRRRRALPTRRSTREVCDLIDKAIKTRQNLDMLYITRDDKRKRLKIAPERLATNAQGEQVLVGADISKGARFSYQVVQIERMDTIAP